MGRTVEELLHGGPAHKAISAIELAEWEALEKLRAWEQEQAMKKKK